MSRHRIQWRKYKITDPRHTKKRYHTAARSDLAETTANHHQQTPIGRTHQPTKSHPHKNQQAV